MNDRFQAGWGALGMVVAVEVTEADALDDARRVLAEELAAADDAYSPVRSDTELARLEASDGRITPVSERLCDAVSAALHAAELTGGLVDAAAVTHVDGHGYELRAVRRAARRLVACDRRERRVRLGAGVHLDLGATGKALIADRTVARIAREGVGALVSVGGDVATAGPAPEGGWPVRVADDSRATDGGRIVTLSGGALATSSTTVRGEHIVDPRTGRPADGPWRTASVAAPTCVIANAASTAALILGEGAPDWLERSGLPALLIAHDGRAAGVGGWSA